MMNYEVIQLEEKHVVGLKARTSNADENMTTVIGGLWQSFYNDGVVARIEGKKNDDAIGLYTHYENGVQGAYDVMVCAEVSELPARLDSVMSCYTIPSGTYAKFVIHGHPQTAVMAFWTNLWEMNLNRAYTCDFETYLAGDDFENCEMHLYISIAE